MAVFVAHNSHALHQLKKTCPYPAKIIVQVKNCISRLSGNPPYQTFWHLYRRSIGIPEGVASVAAEEGLRGMILTITVGAIGGVPARGKTLARSPTLTAS